MKSRTKTETTKGRPHPREHGRLATEEIAPPEGGVGWHWLTRAAFLLAVALVIARCTFSEILRDPFAPAPGTDAPPRGAGPATTLVLNLLACLPALLVLARRAIDPTFSPRASWATALMGVLAVWALLSTFWSSDRFAAVVSASTFAAAAALLWAASQLVRSWRRLRLVAGVCLGLLLAFVGHGLYYQFVDLPDFRRDIQKNQANILRERGLEPGSFQADQFVRKALAGEQMGFSRSPNTFAAVLVAVVVVTMGAIAQRRADGDGLGWVALPAAAIALGGYVILLTDSKAAYVTPVFGAGILFVLRLSRGWIARHARFAYGAGVAAVILAAAALVGHGLYHDSLFHPSLTFRWLYWRGAAKLFALHPLLGVGWENFGPHYLGVRLPYPPEEIKDPHNFVVRFFVELGLVGGALLLAWMLRLWWELTRPVVTTNAEPEPTDSRPPTLPVAIVTAVLAVLLNIAASVDFTQIGAYVSLELIRRGITFALLLAGVVTVVLRSSEDMTMDDRPAPWVLYAVLAALGLFLLHNLIDFSLFEAGPMFLFALLAGSALGLRVPSSDRSPRSRVGAAVTLGVAVVLWLVAAVGLAGPVALAEDAAHDADLAVRRATGPAGLAEGARQFGRAFDLVPYNADYAFREAQVLAAPVAPPDWSPAARQALARAITADPNESAYYRFRAEYAMTGPSPDSAAVQADFERALQLDPRDIAMRLRYAEVLERLGARDEARRQYERALAENDLLPLVEPERLKPDKIEQVRQKTRSLEATTTVPTTHP